MRLLDVLLVVLAVLVVSAAMYAVAEGTKALRTEALIPDTPGASATPLASRSPSPKTAETNRSATATLRRVVLFGADLTDPVALTRLRDLLGTTVVGEPSAVNEPLPAAAVADLLPGRVLVVMQLPRASTSRRDALAAVTTIRRNAPGTTIVLLGPLRRGQSYGAGLKSLVDELSVAYIDPVSEVWVSPPTKVSLTGSERRQVATRLAGVLVPLLH